MSEDDWEALADSAPEDLAKHFGEDRPQDFPAGSVSQEQQAHDPPSEARAVTSELFRRVVTYNRKPLAPLYLIYLRTPCRFSTVLKKQTPPQIRGRVHLCLQLTVFDSPEFIFRPRVTLKPDPAAPPQMLWLILMTGIELG
eukprot:EG_transcript_29373